MSIIVHFFYFRQGHGLVRRRKRKHEDANLSNQSSVESIDPQAVIPIVGKRKFVALETKRYVAIAHLQQRLRRAERADEERGSTLVDVPTFESDSTDFERICTAPKNITCVLQFLAKHFRELFLVSGQINSFFHFGESPICLNFLSSHNFVE